MSTTEGALHVRAVAKGRSPLKPMSFFTDVVILVVVRCVVSVKGVTGIGANASITVLALLLRHALFAWLILNGVAPTQQGGNHPPGTRKESRQMRIYTCLCCGGSCKEVTTHFLQVAQ